MPVIFDPFCDTKMIFNQKGRKEKIKQACMVIKNKLIEEYLLNDQIKLLQIYRR